MAFKMNSPFNIFAPALAMDAADMISSRNNFGSPRKKVRDASKLKTFENDKSGEHSHQTQRVGNKKSTAIQDELLDLTVPNDAEATTAAVAEGITGTETPAKFKLGSRIPGIARGGNINKKHSFKVERKKLDKGILGEAHPGRVVIDKSVKKGSAQERQVLSHEGQHVKDMDSGKAAFGDDWVRWEGKTYPRKDGKIKYNGKWDDEGSEKFPWEKSAMKAEK